MDSPKQDESFLVLCLKPILPGIIVHILCTRDLEPLLNKHFVLIGGSSRLYFIVVLKRILSRKY